MQKDLKIGMILGLVLVVAAMLWLFAGPAISPQTKILNLQGGPETASAPEMNDLLEGPDPASQIKNESSPASEESQDEEPPPDEPQWKKHLLDEKIKTQRFHIIREGETLSEISRRYYDSSRKWQKILDANKNTINDVNKIKPGTKIIIPE
jgi:nucleoid-associated protein YgaU